MQQEFTGIKTFLKVKGWIRRASSYSFLMLIRLCLWLYSSLRLFHWAALADWFWAPYLGSEWWQVSVHCQEEREPLLPFSPLLSGFEEDDLSPPVSVYMLHYCGFKLWLWGYITKNSGKYLHGSVGKKEGIENKICSKCVSFLMCCTVLPSFSCNSYRPQFN